MDATLHDHMMKSVKEIVVAWIAGRQIDFGSVSVELIGIVNSSIRLRVDDKIIQIVVPSTFQLHGCASSSTLLKGEVFLVTCVDCTSDELFGNTLQMLNERLERVTIEPDSLSNVLDCLLLALQKYQKAQAYMKEGSPSIQFERVNNLTEERVAQSHDVPDSNDDCSSTRVDDWDIEDDFCEFPAREDVESVAQIQDINAGFLYAMAEEAKLQCDLVREMVKTQKTFQNTSEQIISLQWCDVITDPKALTVYLLIHVGGIVHDDNLASAIGVSVNSPLKILLQFDKNIWMQKKKGLLRPLRGECKVTQDPQASLNDHNEESVEIGHTRGYGSRVLLPNLVHVYFRFLANDITSLEWASENKKLYEELHYFTSMENTFLGLLCFLSARIQTLQDWCPVCWSSLPYTICKLRTCDKELWNGLRCLSNTHLMGSGATYGPGIYFSSQLQLSLRYSNQGSGWNHCILKNGFSVLAICEIINDSFRSQKEASSFSLSTHSGIVVVPPESEMDVAIRYIIVLRSIEENRGQVSIDRTVMSFDHVSVDRTVTSENIDLMKHYMALKLSYAEQQERQQKEHSIERFKSMCKFSEQLQEDDHGAVIAKKKRGYAVVEDSSQNSCLSTRSKKPVAACRAFSTSSLQAIAREYKYIVKQINEARESKPDIQDRDLLILTGVEVILPDETDICRWHVKLDQFLFKSFPIFKDLVSCAQHWGLPEVSIKLECIFSETYPFSPPFIRVVSPRFSLHTGHVTIGGSICMELLTRSGWSPANTFESVIVQVINAIIEGGGRLDKQAVLARSEYSEREAREAFNRVARDHGWS
ncbi:hypothetical protein KP509_11G052900 [Ceratopteris richardii]|uniref:UBC core domain-containing protein n=1 Tax=Ceratopteris richardii TaxID=49495 RepID=A0A8T2TUJ4_CERRI|nr:hypothetical protein KP509_11G052900 [Ceratopteris richardii]